MKNLEKLVLIGMICCTVAAATSFEDENALVNMFSTNIEENALDMKNLNEADLDKRAGVLIQGIDCIASCYDAIKAQIAGIKVLLESVQGEQRDNCITEIDELKNVLTRSRGATARPRKILISLMNHQDIAAKINNAARSGNLDKIPPTEFDLYKNLKKVFKTEFLKLKNNNIIYDFAWRTEKDFAGTEIAEQVKKLTREIINYVLTICRLICVVEKGYYSQLTSRFNLATREKSKNLLEAGETQEYTEPQE
jgi:hypothetical protein